MMAVSTTGHILEAEGVYGSNGSNNDAGILKHILQSPDKLLLFLQEGDTVILDRGFRDVVPTLQELKIRSCLPGFLSQKQKQFTTDEANGSRTVTIGRWPVEAANGKLKQKFKFLDAVIRNSHLPNLHKYFRICCALVNAFCKPSFTESDLQEKMVELAITRRNDPNLLQEKIEATGMNRKRSQWTKASADTVTEFPKLSYEDLQMITLGSYQLKLASRYTSEHLKEDARYSIMLHKEDTGLLRAKIQSRFRKSQHHEVWIEFTPDGNGHESINGWYCACKAGARTMGCCGHVTSVRIIIIRYYKPNSMVIHMYFV
jgi:hypothetical protein